MNRKSTEEFYEKAEELFKSIPKEEVRAWCKHPTTQSLVQSLYGDMAGHFEGWMNGEFTGASGDETVQKNSKAIGGVSAVENILAWIEDAEKGDLYD